MTAMTFSPATLTSPRLTWRGLQHRDVDVIYRQFSDSEMCAYFSDPPCSRLEAAELIAHYTNINPISYWRYATFTHATAEFIGTCGYHFYDASAKQVEIGYDVWKQHWRHGYATEILTVLLSLCVHTLEVNTIYALIGTHNLASQALAHKFGFKPGAFLREVSDHEQQTTTCWHLQPTQSPGWRGA